MNITVIVISEKPKKSPHRFVTRLHAHSSPEQFFLDPKEFYEKWGKSIPEGTHHELEILAPRQEFLATRLLHIHTSAKSPNPFVCYPKAMPTPERALEVFSVWCAGTVLTMETGTDLNTLYSQECGSDPGLFFKIIRDRFQIWIERAVFVPSS